MSGRRPHDRAPSPDTVVLDVDELEDFEEFDLDLSVVVPVPQFAQGSETHDRSAVAKQLDALPTAELDALLIAYLLGKDHDPR